MKPLSTTKTTLVSLSLAFSAFACSSSSSPSGPGGTADGGDAGGGSVTFTEVYTTVLKGNNCTTHHAAGQMDSFLDLSSQSAAFASLVDVMASGPSCGPSADAGTAGDGGTSVEVRVVKGSPSTSLLYQKVSMSTPPCGHQMPLGGTPMSAADMQMISDWITAGAQND